MKREIEQRMGFVNWLEIPIQAVPQLFDCGDSAVFIRNFQTFHALKHSQHGFHAAPVFLAVPLIRLKAEYSLDLILAPRLAW